MGSNDDCECCCSIYYLITCCILVILGIVFGHIALSDYERMANWEQGTALIEEKADFHPDFHPYSYGSSVKIETIAYKNDERFNITIIYPPPTWINGISTADSVKLYIAYIASQKEIPIYIDRVGDRAVTDLPSLGLILWILIPCYLLSLSCACIIIIGGCAILSILLKSYLSERKDHRATEMKTPSP